MQREVTRRGALRWVGRIAAATGLAVWDPRSLAQAASAAKAPARRVIVLDPGHGGVDPGAIGMSGSYEKEIALPTATEVAVLLEASQRYPLLLTPDHHPFLSPQDRRP